MISLFLMEHKTNYDLIKGNEIISKMISNAWPDGLMVWFALRVREIPVSNTGQAHFLN